MFLFWLIYQKKSDITNKDFGVGIDLGVKEFATCSDGVIYPNINKTTRVKQLEKRLKREQRKMSRKTVSIKKYGFTQKNFEKQKLKVQKIYQRLTNIRTDYLNKTINQIVKTKPSFIVVEDLNISSMLKNKYLSDMVAKQKFF